MLTVSNRSSSRGGTGRINTRIVPNSAKISHKSPYFNNLRILSLSVPMTYWFRLVLFGVISVAVHAIDPREYFRHRRV